MAHLRVRGLWQVGNDGRVVEDKRAGEQALNGGEAGLQEALRAMHGWARKRQAPERQLGGWS